MREEDGVWRPVAGVSNRLVRLLRIRILLFAAPVILTASAAEPSASSPDAGIEPPARPRIGLALGGGGARGAAHLGVFRVLEELRIPIDYCAGTSMGAIMGALYASGMSPDEMNEAIDQVDWRLLFHDAPARSDISMRRKEEDQLPLFGFEMGLERHGIILPSGIIAGQKLQFLLRTLTLASTDIERFDELPIPFRAVACDLATGEMVVLDHGDLSDAMRASMAIPGAFTPEKAEGRILVDGGIVQNLPVETVREMGADVVIAVDVGSALPQIEESDPSFVGVATRALDLLTRANSRVSRNTLGPSDVLIAPDLPEIDTSSFDRMLIAARHGEDAARAKIDDLRRYSVSEEEYSAWQGRVRGWAEARAGKFRIESIEVTGTRRVSPELIKRRIRTREGSHLDMELLRGDLDRIARIGEFERIDFSIDGGEGARRLVIQAREKSWGPGYLRIGLGIEGDFDADADIVATLHYRRAFANRLGGEWRAALGGGDRLTLDSDFYQPLVESGVLFISPSVRLLYDKDRFFLEEDQPVVGKIHWYHGQLDVGIQIENAVELRAGILRGRFEGETDVALNPLDSRAQIGAVVARLLYDRLDEYPLPRCGSWLQTDLTLSRAGLGGDGEYDRLLVRLANARSLGKNTVFFRSIFGTDFGTRLPLYDRHTLGGFLRLSGLEPDALVGDIVTFASLVYYREIDRLAPFLGRGIVLGCAIEGGEVWDRISEFRLRNLRPAGLLLLGGRTVLGPVYFGYGATEQGQTAGYFYIGKPFP